MTKVQGSAQSSPRLAPNSALRLFAMMMLGSILLVPLVSGKEGEVVRAPSGVSYVTGGVGLEEIDRLRGMEKDFNLKVVFADSTGAYLSAIPVRITDRGGRVVLESTTEGPVLMVRLAPGRHQVEATFAGQSKRQQITVGANKLSRVDFRWPAQ
jgi:hypothetical protein